MFWKKKKPASESHSLIASTNQRDAFRVTPTPERPVYIRLLIIQKKLPVLNISATGLAFKVQGLKKGIKIDIQLDLPGPQPPIEAALKVLRVKEGVCYCKFKTIAPEATELIHGYVLQLQKDTLQKQKRFQPDTSPIA